MISILIIILTSRYRPRRKPKNPLASQSQNMQTLSMQQQAKQQALQQAYSPFHHQLPPYFAAAAGHPLDQHYSVPYFSGFDPLTLQKLSQQNNGGHHQMSNNNNMSQSQQNHLLQSQMEQKMSQSPSLGSFYSGLYNNITSPAAALYAAHSAQAAGIYTPSSTTSSGSPGSSPNGSHSALPDMDSGAIRRPVPVLY